MRILNTNHALPVIVRDKIFEQYVVDWHTTINRERSGRGNGHNKLRKYCLFKNIYGSENYCKMILPLNHRAAFSKFRCGVAQLRIETGRYENLDVDDRKCPFCDSIEDESHVLFQCSVYSHITHVLTQKACIVNPNFENMSMLEKTILVFSDPFLIRITAKSCFEILKLRSFYLCK